MIDRRQFEDRLKALSVAFAPPSGTDGELVFEQTEERSVAWSDKKPHVQSYSLGEGLSVRVQNSGKEGLASATQADPALLPRLLESARRNSRISGGNSPRTIQGPRRRYSDEVPSDQTLFTTSIDELLASLQKIERSVLRYDTRLKKIVRLNYRESFRRRGLANNQSLFLADESSAVTVLVEILAEEEGATEVAWEYQTRRFARGLPMERLVQSVAERALRMLGGGPIPSGLYSLVLSPRVGTQLLSLLAGALSAEAVQLGRSFLKDKRGEKAAALTVHVMDDPFLTEGVASATFDDEGTPHEPLDVIEGGVLKDYFYDLRSAARENRDSNGHGIRASLSARPHPSPTNLYIKAGRAEEGAMLASSSKVFVVEEVMGLHMADPITGEFSLGAMGSLYENGKFSKPVRGVTIAHSVGELMQNIIGVGNDLTWYGSYGSPSLLVSGVSVGGI